MSVQDSRKETINSHQLELGMFVSELDRPWLDSPFMLQGFLLEDENQIRQIRSLCKHVVIDRTLSIGEHYAEGAKEDAVTKRSSKAPDSNFLPQKENKNVNQVTEKISFFDILRELNAKQKSQPPSLINEKNISRKSLKENSTFPKVDDQFGGTPKQESSSLKVHIKNDLINVMSKLQGWLPGRKKTKNFHSKIDAAANNIASSPPEGIITVEEEMSVIYPVFEQTQIATRKIFEAVATESNIDIIHVNQTLDTLVDSIERNPDALMWLTKLKQQDNYAYNHALNVSINLMAFASFIALPRNQIKDIGMAGLLQDIGKLKIPPELLQKEDQLSDEELEVMKSHVQIGLDLLKKTENVSPVVLEIIANHHERIDRSGYPSQLHKTQFSLAAQMAGMMDSYCALTTDKPYAKGIFNQEALEQLYAAADKEYSSELVNQLIQFFGIYPVSSLVELNSGEVAVVIQQNQVRRLLPRVMVLLNADKTRNKHPAVVDLIHLPNTPDGKPYKIIRGLAPNSYGLNPADFFIQ